MIAEIIFRVEFEFVFPFLSVVVVLQTYRHSTGPVEMEVRQNAVQIDLVQIFLLLFIAMHKHSKLCNLVTYPGCVIISNSVVER